MSVSASFPRKFVVNLLFGSVALTSLMGCGTPAPLTQAKPAVTFTFKPDVAFTANPNPIKGDPSGLGSTQLTFSTKVNFVEIHVGSPNGTLLCKARGTGTCDATGWVADGMAFYLQDSSAARPEDSAATLGGVIVRVK